MATFQNNPVNTTTLVAVINEVWTPLTLREYFANAVAAAHFTDLSQYAAGGGDIFRVPDFFTNVFTVQTQSTAGTEVVEANPASVDITITVNTHKYVAIFLDDFAQQQVSSVYNASQEYAHKAGGALMIDFEDQLFALWSGLTTNSIGDTATVLNDSEIRRSIEKLVTANFPMNETAWFFHPFVLFVQLYAVQRYYDASQWGARPGQGMLETGTFANQGNWGKGFSGFLYGMPVYQSSRVVSGLQTYRNLLAHKTAFGYVRNTPGSPIRMQSAYWLANIGLLVVWDTMYGVAELRDAAAVVVNANSSFIGS